MAAVVRSVVAAVATLSMSLLPTPVPMFAWVIASLAMAGAVFVLSTERPDS